MDAVYRGALVGSCIGGGAGILLAYGIGKVISLDKDVVKVMGLSIGYGVLGGAWIGGVYSCVFVVAGSLFSRVSQVAYQALEKR